MDISDASIMRELYPGFDINAVQMVLYETVEQNL
jgi:hypothetical protein